MNLIWLILLLLIFLINIINTTNLRCYDDKNGSSELIENCRACVIYIDTKIKTAVSPRKMMINDDDDDDSLTEELFLYDEKNHHHRRRRWNTETIIHQKCARESDGPIYGFDQTHCYCNSNLCNSNIQRCIYEIASKRYFSCYHGTNTSTSSLEIYKKCRSCRIKKEFNLTYHYECLTFGEQEQKSSTHCTCQHPMCNQDFSICQRFQQLSSQSRAHLLHENHRSNSTATTTTTTTTLTINSTKLLTTILILNQTEQDNSTTFELTSISSNETKQINPIIIEPKNHANFFLTNFFQYFFSFYIIVNFTL